ncbi:MAG: hypothetical protein H0X33_01795 [Taibaiella sp.]|nr:hypothetical protein [Taibaiella sp.]
MSNDTHQHAEHMPHQSQVNKSRTSFTASFWFVVILVGLFVCALNFVNVMSSDEGEGKGGKTTSKPVEAPMEATAGQTLAGEKGLGKAIDSPAKSATPTPADSTRH